MATENFFTWGAGGAKLTPEQIALARQLLARKNAQGADTSPVQHWAQGAARVADALGDVFQERRLNAQEKDLTDYNSGLISNLLSGGGAASASPSIPSPGAAAELSGGGDPQSYRDAIASIESAGSGDYAAVGPTNPKLGRALGRYQIMEANIAPWSQEALGRTVTPDEFLANPKLQDAIFDKKFGSYVQQYGPEGASQAWFAGPGGVGKLDRKDSLGTSVAAYSDKFNRAIGAGGQQVASLDPGAGMQPAIPAPEAAAQIQGSQQAAPALPPATTVSAPPPVASAPAVAAPAPNMQVAQDASGPALANAIKVLSDPRANANTKAIAEILVRQAQARQQAVLEQQLKQSDPAYQQGLQKGAIELENLRNPKMSPSEAANLKLNQDKFTADTANNADKLKLDREKFEAELQKGQWQKLTDGRLYNQTSGEFRDAPPPVPGSTPPKMDDISSMRKEIQQLPSYKNLAQAAPIYKAMAETAGRNSKASDLNLVYGLGKIMDPTSVVREGEMVMVKNTASLPDWLQGAIASLNGGAALTPETRQAIMTEAYGRVKGYSDEFNQNMGQYEGIVQRNGINRADVIPETDAFEPWKAPEASGPAQIKTVDDYHNLAPGTQYIDPNGKLRTKQ